MKKVISLILAIAMAGSLFVSAKNIENHNELTSNRYSYRYKFSSREKDGEYKIVEPTKSREAAETAAEVAVSSCTFSTKFPAGVVAIVVFHLGSAIYDKKCILPIAESPNGAGMRRLSLNEKCRSL